MKFGEGVETRSEHNNTERKQHTERTQTIRSETTIRRVKEQNDIHKPYYGLIARVASETSLS